MVERGTEQRDKARGARTRGNLSGGNGQPALHLGLLDRVGARPALGIAVAVDQVDKYGVGIR
jgi:hypothetical protein